MAGIRPSTVELVDNATPALRGINKALILVINSFKDMRTVSRDPVNISGIEEARQELSQLAATVKKIEENMENAGKRTDENTKKVDTLTAALKKAAMDAVISKTADAIKKTISSTIEYSSELQQVQNMIDVVFGNNSAVNEWAKTTLNAFGLNEVAAKKYAGTMGAMLKSSGLTGNAVETMAMRITELTADMASLYDLGADDIFSKLTNAISSGETEPLKLVGVDMSAENLQAYALAEGIEKSYDSMSQAEQVALRYQYVIDATADVQGNFANTSGSYASQVSLLKDNWLQFTSDITGSTLPALTQLLEYLNTILSKLDEYVPALQIVAIAIGLVTLAIAGYEIGMLLAAQAQNIFNIAMKNCPLMIVLAVISLLITAFAMWVQKVGDIHLAWLIMCDAILTKTAMLGVGVLNILQGMVNGAIDIINSFIGALNCIPGVSLDLIEHVTFADSASLAAEAAHQERQKGIDNKRAELGLSSAANGLNQGLDMFTNEDTMGGIITNTNDIASNTGDISDSLEIADEDLKYLRDMAEQEAVNRFTTAEIKIDMQNNNNISSGTDLDGIVSSLEDKLYESMTIAAEGV